MAKALKAYARDPSTPPDKVWEATCLLSRLALAAKDVPKAELYAQRAWAMRPRQPEPLLRLVTHMRVNGLQHGKSWYYLSEIDKVATGGDVARAAYERIIVAYYVADFPTGLATCVKYNGPTNIAQINMHWYVRPLPSTSWHRLAAPVPLGFVSSSVGATGGVVNVRAVNYAVNGGRYDVPGGGSVITKNFYVAYDAPRRALDLSTFVEVRDPTHLTKAQTPGVVRGLEDVRLCGTEWTATTQEYSTGPWHWSVVFGRRYPDMSDAVVVPSPFGNRVEKNWLPLGRGRVLYGWHPLRVGVIDAGGTLTFTHEVHSPPEPRPWWWQHLRGSAVLDGRVDGKVWVLVHVVLPQTPRVYVHAWLALDEASFVPVSHTPFFTLRHTGIEYVEGAVLHGDFVHVFASVDDSQSWVGVVPVSVIQGMMMPTYTARTA
jgi:hypothetical protein